MKLLFVHPGPLLYTNVFLRLEPLGLELVAEAARRRKHSVRLIDLQVESPGRRDPAPRGNICGGFSQGRAQAGGRQG